MSILGDLIYRIDQKCRKDLLAGAIVSERDYISIFSNFIRYPFGPFSTIFIGHCQTSPSKLEQKYGFDGILILEDNTNYYIGIFEAKRIKKKWDSKTKTRPPISRFSRQLRNQEKITNPKIYKWEMFLNDNESDTIYDSQGSTCVKFEVANKYKKTSTSIEWDFDDLKKLLTESKSKNYGKPINIKQIIDEMLTKPSFAFSKTEKIYFDNEQMVAVPTKYGDGINEMVTEFLNKTNLDIYLNIKFDSLEHDSI